MNKESGGNRGPRRVAALAVAAAVAVLVTACGGGDPSSASPPTYAQELALAQCMRGHGVADFPDPQASGGYSLGPNGTIQGAGGSVDINSSQVQAAYGHCRHLLPGGPSVSQLEQKVQQAQQREEQELPAMVKFAQCMRSHAVPDFPDPALSGQSAPASGTGPVINPSSPRFEAAVRACQHLLPAGAHISINKMVGSRKP
ncbi:MAG: hypothetical protein ACRDPO_13170 [Streptosporangiaceae bacterium]